MVAGLSIRQETGWLSWEKQQILAYHSDHPLDGYRRLTYMMIDADIVAVSPSSVYRVLRDAGVLRREKQDVNNVNGPAPGAAA